MTELASSFNNQTEIHRSTWFTSVYSCFHAMSYADTSINVDTSKRVNERRTYMAQITQHFVVRVLISHILQKTQPYNLKDIQLIFFFFFFFFFWGGGGGAYIKPGYYMIQNHSLAIRN